MQLENISKVEVEVIDDGKNTSNTCIIFKKDHVEKQEIGDISRVSLFKVKADNIKSIRVFYMTNMMDSCDVSIDFDNLHKY